MNRLVLAELAALIVVLGCSAPRVGAVAVHPAPAAPSQPHKDYVRLLALSRDGKVAATWGRDALRLWDVDAGHARCDVPLPALVTSKGSRLALADIQADGLPGDLTALAFTADGKALLTGGRDARLRSFRTADCRPLGVATPGLGAVRALATGATEAWISATEQQVQVWRGAALDRPVQTLHLGRTVDLLALDAAGRRLAAVTGEDEFAYVELRELDAPEQRTPLGPGDRSPEPTRPGSEFPP